MCHEFSRLHVYRRRSCVPFPFPTVPNLNTELIETVERSSTGNSAVLPPRLTLRNLREGKFLQFQTLLFSLQNNVQISTTKLD